MKRIFLGSFLMVAGLLGACRSDSDPEVAPDGPATPPKPYALVVPRHFPPQPAQPADNPLTEEGVALGRQLFYETALSVNSQVSCGTCHRQEKAFTDGLARSVGVNQRVSTRSSMGLFNLLWEPKLTWDGSSTSLESQARIPIEKDVEMHQSLAVGVARLQQLPAYPALFRKAFGSSTITEANTLKALAQFERTLISGNSRYDRFLAGNRTALSSYELQGLTLFMTHPTSNLRGGNCGDCHGGPLLTNHLFSNNGLDATFTDRGLGAITGLPTDDGKFRIPSLRNIALTAPYMHDGRFRTLEEVVGHYNEHVALNSPTLDPLIRNATNDPRQQSRTLDLTVDEKAKIVAFMRTLTDSTFIRDPRFARP